MPCNLNVPIRLAYITFTGITSPLAVCNVGGDTTGESILYARRHVARLARAEVHARDDKNNIYKPKGKQLVKATTFAVDLSSDDKNGETESVIRVAANCRTCAADKRHKIGRMLAKRHHRRRNGETRRRRIA